MLNVNAKQHAFIQKFGIFSTRKFPLCHAKVGVVVTGSESVSDLTGYGCILLVLRYYLLKGVGR